jgi:type IV secretory pathway TraG/TraD family ATPase VirD4
MLQTKNKFKKYEDIDRSVKVSQFKTSLNIWQTILVLIATTMVGWIAYKYLFISLTNMHFKSAQDALRYYTNFAMPKLKNSSDQFAFFVAAATGSIALVMGVGAIFRGSHIRLAHPYVGIEQGSARFGKIPQEVKPLIDPPDPPSKPYFYNKNNMIFTQRVGMSLNIRKTHRNDNVLVIGGSGAGKTRFFVIPNLLQAHTSYIVTDPKGEISRNTGWFLKKMGYDVRIFDLVDMEYSSRYNPFNYFVHGEEDVLGLIDTIIQSTNQGQKPSDPFWEKAESLLLSAIMSYIFTELPKGDRTIGTVMDMLREINNMKVIDTLFSDLLERNPNSYAAKLWQSFKVVGGSPKTASSIYITATTRLQVWNQARVRMLMSEDTVQLDKMGDRPTALFIVVPDSAKTYNFIAAMMYKQLFSALYYKADKIYGNHNDPRFNEGRLPYHVRFMMDEFPNIGRISEFEEILATSIL